MPVYEDEISGEKIIEKDGDGLIKLIPLTDWNTYAEVFPVYSAHHPGEFKRLLD